MVTMCFVAHNSKKKTLQEREESHTHNIILFLRITSLTMGISSSIAAFLFVTERKTALKR